MRLALIFIMGCSPMLDDTTCSSPIVGATCRVGEDAVRVDDVVSHCVDNRRAFEVQLSHCESDAMVEVIATNVAGDVLLNDAVDVGVDYSLDGWAISSGFVDLDGVLCSTGSVNLVVWATSGAAGIRTLAVLP